MTKLIKKKEVSLVLSVEKVGVTVSFLSIIDPEALRHKSSIIHQIYLSPQNQENQKEILKRLNEVVPWKSFCELLDSVHDQPCKSRIEHQAIDVIVMFIDIAIDIATVSQHQ
ncbi:MAG: hypothetical protein HXY43_05830 [Fischerella sp.]|uniref:hypothetical protein n=1 Tax=Fischerella sp. TaxID=1191 RepID=UPI0017FA8676|nr:hypothetical protein [Fischerella sp.]NWF58829.1 hypothetical protein [Fischerella sp.]